MYNRIGSQTPRGSGTNGYIQTNKFFIKSKTGKVAAENSRGFEGDQGMAKKPNKDILLKLQIELHLVVLEDNFTDQGFTNVEIPDKVAQARRTLEATAAASKDLYSSGSPPKPDKKKRRRSRSSSSDKDDYEVNTSKNKVEKYKKKGSRGMIQKKMILKLMLTRSRRLKRSIVKAETIELMILLPVVMWRPDPETKLRNLNDPVGGMIQMKIDDVDKKRKVVMKHNKTRNDDTDDDSAASEDAEDRSTKEV
ncbi:pre-mRNA-splicing factor CWC21-like [Rosa chinensis]|uniref:pre-mRNA-splicing factor CWC21-like n=1 Tax=Rosa chinensis TaxID=74649 RepID=UPI000D08CA44|nr:pre-mRNA-splicing factor CWC21-like [Rosa chinensis]